MRSIYFALVHPYIIYANIAWASANKTYLKGILGKRKQVARLIPSDDISIPSRLLMKELSILDIYQTYTILYKHSSFMFKVKSIIIPRAFKQVFSSTDHLNPTRFSDNSFKISDFNLKLTCFAIDFRGPTIGNNFFMESEKSYNSIDVFKNKIKEKILYFPKELLFF